ncbi:MAG: antibiotic biosynthesis monooxygenase [Alphaproteobacteria bacterium]|nr:antibiotic biosynthesis monooxygenase [Alphaproteobacteria bacterium]|tara:strand:- start:1251 stop:1556 length:306 start_codon:yes stop_codon:yes gene_type:complete
MIAVIFEVTPREGHADDYFDAAAALKQEVEAVDGFISVERFESLTTPGKYLSISLWRDEDAVRTWRENMKHRAAQERGKREIFAHHHIRVTEILREYTSNT